MILKSSNKSQTGKLINNQAANLEGEGAVFVKSESLIKLRRFGEQLELKIGRALALQSGGYNSAFKGRGMEFDEARPYQPGDDVRSLDWRVTARTGKPYTKLFREERERPILICVDFRRPMFFATRGKFKSVCASELAAMIAWCAANQGDRLGGLFFSELEHNEIRPQRGKLAVLRFIKDLANHTEQYNSKSVNSEFDSNNALQNAFMRLRRVAKPGSMVFVISDFRQFDKQAESHLSYLSRHNEVILMCINDPMERELPNNGICRLKDNTKVVTIDTSNKNLRQEYRTDYLKRMQHINQFCGSNQAHFTVISTTDDIAHALSNVLRKSR